MAYKYLLLKKENHIATLTLNRPERLNALFESINDEITAALQEVGRDEEVRALVITGAGRAFCAGGDFKGGRGTPASIALEPGQRQPARLARGVRAYTAGIPWGLQNLDIPTIAMVNGVAAGAGFDIALACDLRLGSENTRFQVAWTRRGLTTAFGTTWFLPRLIGVGRAADLIFTARMVEAPEALQLGILNRLVPASDLERETMELADQIAKGPPLALRLSKKNLYKGLNLDLPTALDFLASSQSQLFMTEDFVESTRAFQEKREPVFRGR